MGKSLFRPEEPVWNICNTLTDTLLLSGMWCLYSLPVVTLGASTTALYDAAARCIRCKEPGTITRFRRTFRREFRTGLPGTLLLELVLLFGVYVLSLLDEAATMDIPHAALLAGGYRVLLALPMCVGAWMCMLLSRFTCRPMEALGNALRFLPGHLMPSVAVAVLSWAFCWYVSNYPIGLFFAPVVLAVGWSFAAEPVFRKYGGDIHDKSQNRE